MTGPYKIRLLRGYFEPNGGETLAVFDADPIVRDPDVYTIADRYRALAFVSGPLVNAERASVLVAAKLLAPGESVDAEIVGRVAGREAVCRTVRTRRESDGRLVSSIGSRFGEREIQGL